MEHKVWEHTNTNTFFDAYAAAMQQQDTRLMTRFYEWPCTLMGDGITNVYSEPNRLEGLFNQGIVYYGQIGVRSFKPELWSRHQLNEHYMRVRVKWHHCDESGVELYHCFYEYVLHSDKSGFWKMQVVVSIDEKERLAAYQLSQQESPESL